MNLNSNYFLVTQYHINFNLKMVKLYKFVLKNHYQDLLIDNFNNKSINNKDI